MDDKKLSENIGDIVKELQSDRFRELIEERSRSQTLQKKYEALETNYAKAKEREFDVVFAGVYSKSRGQGLSQHKEDGAFCAAGNNKRQRKNAASTSAAAGSNISKA